MSDTWPYYTYLGNVSSLTTNAGRRNEVAGLEPAAMVLFSKQAGITCWSYTRWCMSTAQQAGVISNQSVMIVTLWVQLSPRVTRTNESFLEDLEDLLVEFR